MLLLCYNKEKFKEQIIMEDIKKIHLNNPPKALRLFLILLPVVGFIFIPLKLDNDFYFLYPTGEYIINNGFPVKDFLSMHAGMDIIVQQWLVDVVFYALYSAFGKAGIIGFLYLCYAAFATVTYKLCYLISENLLTSSIVAFITDMIAANIYMRSRPHALSFVLFLLEIYALEKYVKTKSAKWLIILPCISLVLINAHASMWLLMFVFALPYAAQAIPFKFKKLEQKPCCNFFILLCAGAVCFAAGFINPYGIKAMTYVFTSFGNSTINSLIYEMNPPKLTDSFGLLLFPLIFITVGIVAFTRHKSFQTRFVLLYLGTMALGLMTCKSVPFFAFLGMCAFTYYLKDLDFVLKIEQKKQKRTKKEIILLALLGTVFAAALIVLAILPNGSENKTDSELHDYGNLDAAVEILNEEENIVLFTGFNQGQYLEFNGYHPYIDGRAELFLKENNGEFDYFGEYADLISGRLDYKEFVDKYHFTHLIVSDTEKPLRDWLLKDSDYEVLYEGGNFTLFRRK